MKTEFNSKLKDLGFSYQCNADGFYIMSLNNDPNGIINAQLILSELVDEVIQGNRNNNKIQTIGFFKIGLPTEVKENDFLILAFQNTSNHRFDFIIIPTKELMTRLVESNRISSDNQEIELIFWLMPDNRLYETSDLGVEGQWYYLSKSPRGRLADNTVRDYTEFLNNWGQIMKT
jgi:hypothetical protein